MKFFRKPVAKIAAILAIPFAASVVLSATAMADNSAATHAVHVTATSTHSVQVGWRGVGPTVPDEVLVYNASTLQLVKHTTREAGHSDGRVVELGAGYEGEALAVKVAFVVDGVNTGWTQPVLFYTNVASGTAGAQGPKGDAGPAGPSGVVSSGVHSLLDAPLLVHTGGTFSTQEQLAGSVDLQPGTYLVTVNAKAAWASGTGVYPQFFVYNGTVASDFSNNLFNIGSGELADGNATIDSYFSGTSQITVTSPTTLKIYAFGYDKDRGAGTFTLETMSIVATQLQVALAA